MHPPSKFINTPWNACNEVCSQKVKVVSVHKNKRLVRHELIKLEC